MHKKGILYKKDPPNVLYCASVQVLDIMQCFYFKARVWCNNKTFWIPPFLIYSLWYRLMLFATFWKFSPWNMSGRSSDPVLSPLHQHMQVSPVKKLKLLSEIKVWLMSFFPSFLRWVMDLQIWLWSYPQNCSEQLGWVHGPTRCVKGCVIIKSFWCSLKSRQLFQLQVSLQDKTSKNYFLQYLPFNLILDPSPSGRINVCFYHTLTYTHLNFSPSYAGIMLHLWHRRNNYKTKAGNELSSYLIQFPRDNIELFNI